MHSINSSEYFKDHVLVSYFSDEKTGLCGYISIHKGNGNIPAFGATRVWNYRSDEDALVDSLRLSRLMSYKAALAGLNCGGAKAALIMPNGGIKDRHEFFKKYAKKVNFLSGRFVTGADVGVDGDDVKTMKRYSKHIVGVKTDPVRFTGLGIFYAIQECLKEVYGTDSLKKRSFAIQGLGKVGQSLLNHIYEDASEIFVCDINKDVLDITIKRYPRLKVVTPEEIHKQKVDIFSPCALGNCLNHITVKEMNCQIIAGGANNQLEDETIAEQIYNKGVLYAPDYVANAGGLISVYDEYEHGNYRINRVKKRVGVVKNNMARIIKESKKNKKNTNEVANKMAENIFKQI